MGRIKGKNTHRLYVLFKNGEKPISKAYSCISSAWFDASDWMKKHKVSEIKIVKI